MEWQSHPAGQNGLPQRSWDALGPFLRPHPPTKGLRVRCAGRFRRRRRPRARNGMYCIPLSGRRPGVRKKKIPRRATWRDGASSGRIGRPGGLFPCFFFDDDPHIRLAAAACPGGARETAHRAAVARACANRAPPRQTRASLDRARVPAPRGEYFRAKSRPHVHQAALSPMQATAPRISTSSAQRAKYSQRPTPGKAGKVDSAGTTTTNTPSLSSPPP